MSTDSIFTEVVNFVKLTMSTMDLIGFAIFLHYIYKNPVLLSKMLNRYIFLLAIFNLLSVILATAKDLIEFESNKKRREEIVHLSSKNSGLSVSRLDKYFCEVFNRLDSDHIIGLNTFLKDACGLTNGAEFLDV